MPEVDLSGAEVVDDHCHPYRIEDLLRRDPMGLEARCTFLGTGLASSGRGSPERWAEADRLTDSAVFALALRRWLAAFLGCEPTKAAVAAARAAAFRADPAGYTKRLLEDQRVRAVLADDGYPQPTVPVAEFEAAIGVPAYRVARIEPWIVAHREEGFDALVAGLEAELEAAGADPRCVAFKSVIAYRTGLDVGPVTEAEARRSFERWRADGWRETREHAKPVRDFLLRRALELARRLDRPVHVHCGGGDPDIKLSHARPQDLFPLLLDHPDQPIVLVHAGYPWVAEAGYVASVLPHVYLDLSELVPWGWSEVDRALETLLGMVPTAKLLYGSDQASEPEVFWVSARLAREALARTLSALVDRDHLTLDQAEQVGRQVLAGNARRLHGIGG